jgi:adhesin transport system outer membrane protein
VSVQPGAGLSTAAGIRAALARKESAAESRRNVEQELRQALAADFASHKATVEQIGVGNLLRQSTQEVADSYARQFVAGRKSWQEVLNAVREAMQARLSVMDAQALFAQTAWRLHLRAFGLESTPGAAS